MDLEEQYDKIYRYCYFKLYDKQLAQDITQETFLRFFRQELRCDSRKALPYLYTIARNLCADHLRKKTVESWEDRAAEAAYDPTGDWITDLALQTALSRLPQGERELLFLRYGNEMGVAEMGRITGLSRFAVYRRLSGALKRLREEGKKEGLWE